MTKNFKIFISTGEISGDLQGGLLVAALFDQAEARGWELEITGLGGQRMAAAGAKIIYDTRRISSIGFVEALRYVAPTIKFQALAKKQLQNNPPDLVIFIDYIAANLTLGNYIRQHLPVPTVYYIAPQEWIWSHSPKTTQKLIEISDQMIAIFPEEERYYKKHGANITWVGHPLVDRVKNAPNRDQARQQLGLKADELAIVLFPVSRYQEIKSLLPLFLSAVKIIQAQLPQARFWLSLSLAQYRAEIAATVAEFGLEIPILEEPLLLIAAADLTLAKSGTVNLEIALMNVPQVVVYRINPFGLWLYQTFLKFDLDYVSPPNLIAMEPVVPELLQENATPDKIAATSLDILQNPQTKAQMLAGYDRVKHLAGEPGAVRRAAQSILNLLAQETATVNW
ncbi:lipid-A-disaccharide synthase [Thermosynechococcaceae cyanobacterium BACA0444]|uniref:Lipid-A-disaccharide synthase n=1 Tax=Pseudocalidococcus azoricus BACA0444 TaxID=2918990 RepID=A0AAE4FNG3_9CYAN|nr:lipid-A-disaccharide synthase [Pseudocalidococcus azoricus]MDS3859324.1 lipid-A-disaccharide synthase [Pseudocalidococcus azoricus BACA0444]